MKNILNFSEFDLNESTKHNPKAELRNRGDVVFPAENRKVLDDKDHFPINNLKQARNALARVKQYSSVPKWYDGTLGEVIEKVYKAVHKKYPSIDIDEIKFED